MTAVERVPPGPPLPPAPPTSGDQPPPDDPQWPTPSTRLSLWQWLREARGELRKVALPSRSSVIGNSIIVVCATVVVVATIAALDVGLTRATTALFG